MRWLEQDRARRPTTLRGCDLIMRGHLLPAFGERRLGDITANEVAAWSATLAAPREGEAGLIADAFAPPSLDPTGSMDGA